MNWVYLLVPTYIYAFLSSRIWVHTQTMCVWMHSHNDYVSRLLRRLLCIIIHRSPTRAHSYLYVILLGQSVQSTAPVDKRRGQYCTQHWSYRSSLCLCWCITPTHIHFPWRFPVRHIPRIRAYNQLWYSSTTHVVLVIPSVCECPYACVHTTIPIFTRYTPTHMTTIVTWSQTNMFDQLSQLAREDVQIPPLETPRELTLALTLTIDGNPSTRGSHFYHV